MTSDPCWLVGSGYLVSRDIKLLEDLPHGRHFEVEEKSKVFKLIS